MNKGMVCMYDLELVYTKIPHIYKKNLILFNFMLDAVLCL